MEMKIYLDKIENLSKTNNGVRLYPYKDPQKLLSRFEQRMFWIEDKYVLINGWLGEIYKCTDGIDLCNFYIVPFNNYFNKKKFDFEGLCRNWIINQNNPNEILADFYTFMTDGNLLIGYLDNLKDPYGNNFIGIAFGKPVSDVIIISSSIYVLLNEVIKQLSNNNHLTISDNIDYWKERDMILSSYYNNGNISKYKKDYLYQSDSINYNS